MKTRIGIAVTLVSALSAFGCDAPDDEVAAEPPTARIELCSPGQIRFDGRCMSSANIDQIVDFADEDATFLALSACEEDGATIHGCADVLVAVGEEQKQLEYRIVDDDTGCYVLVADACFGGWNTHFYIAHDIEAYANASGFFVHTKARFKADKAKRVGNLMTVVTKNGATHETITRVSGWALSPGMYVDRTYRVTDADGEVVAEETESYLAQSSAPPSEDGDVAEDCDVMADTAKNVLDGTTEILTGACDLLPDNVKIDLGIIEAQWDVSTCDKVAGGTTKIVDALADYWAYDCKTNPETLMPDLYSEQDGLESLPEPDSGWVDEAGSLNCPETIRFDGQVAYVDGNGLHCTAIATMTVTCWTESSGCVCDEEPTVDWSSLRDHVCTS